jgi:adenylate cyclase
MEVPAMKKLPILFSLAILLSAIIIIVLDLPLKSILQNISFDTFQRLHPREFQNAPVRIVDIDEESLRRHGQWPWPRILVADLVTRLTNMDAAAVVFDVVFAEPDRMSPKSLARFWPTEKEFARLAGRYPDYDEILARAIGNGPIVTGFSCSSQVLTGNQQPAVKARFVAAGDDPAQFLVPFKSAVKNLPVIEAAASGNGAFNYMADYDGVLRHVPLLLRINNDIYPSLSAEALRVAQGAQNIVVKSSGASGENRFGGHTGIVGIRIGSLPIETDAKGEVWLNYSNEHPERYIPAWKVLSGEVDSKQIAGHILFLGTSAKGLLDVKVNPLGGTIPGVEIHAQLVEQIIQKSYLLHPDWSSSATVLFLLVNWIILSLLVSRSSAMSLAFMAAGWIGITFTGSWMAFTRSKIFIDPLFPSIAIAAMYSVGSFCRFLETERDRKWIRDAFSSYISPNLVRHLIDNPQLLKTGGEKRECSFVLTDLAGFTTLMEKLDPDQVVSILNEYIDEMLNIAFQFDATVDRIVGDAIALMFSAPVVQEDHANRALSCAVALDAFAHTFSTNRQKQGIPLGGTRIGVNTGMVVIGNFGGKTMFDYRALGDPINTCSRLESVNKYFGTRICVSRQTVDKCPGFIGRPVGTLVLKGKSQGIETFEPLTQAEMDSPHIQAYLAAYRLLAQNDPCAQEAFALLLSEYPSDALTRFHLERLESGATGVVVVMDQK